MSGKTRTTSAAFSQLAYQRYSRVLRTYIMNRVRNSEDTRDLAQEVWTRLLRIRDPGKVIDPRKYIYRVAANVVTEFQHLRRRDPVEIDSEVFAAATEVAPDAERMADRLNAQRDVLQALAPLSAVYREIVLLRLREGLSYGEIGQKMGFTAATAERYFFSAMAQARSDWAGRNK